MAQNVEGNVLLQAETRESCKYWQRRFIAEKDSTKQRMP